MFTRSNSLPGVSRSVCLNRLQTSPTEDRSVEGNLVMIFWSSSFGRDRIGGEEETWFAFWASFLFERTGFRRMVWMQTLNDIVLEWSINWIGQVMHFFTQCAEQPTFWLGDTGGQGLIGRNGEIRGGGQKRLIRYLSRGLDRFLLILLRSAGHFWGRWRWVNSSRCEVVANTGDKLVGSNEKAGGTRSSGKGQWLGLWTG